MSYSYKGINNANFPYRLEKMEVFFRDESCLDIIKAVLDEQGMIRNFPGIIKDERWAEKHRIGQRYDVRFEARFLPIDDGEYLMLWMIQPDGWYWVDEDGFGFNGDSSIVLYSVTDQTGNFRKAFELFSIDATRYCHTFDGFLQA